MQVAPLLPKPKPAARLETYSVVVNNVRVQDLLFALARDAKLNVDIHSDITGTVTLNAIDQTLPQLLARIARQVDMRYEIDGQNLTVMRDTPFLRVLQDRLPERDAQREDELARLDPVRLLQLGHRRRDHLRHEHRRDRAGRRHLRKQVLGVDRRQREGHPARDRQDHPEDAAGRRRGAAGRRRPARPPARAAPASAPAQAPQQSVEFREAASVIANRESGVLYVRATSRQHEKVQEFLDQVLVGAKRQVLIEATVAEVQLNNQYQRGIDWQRLRSNATTVGRPAFGTGQAASSSARTPPARRRRSAPPPSCWAARSPA